jgi:hypothetical protein
VLEIGFGVVDLETVLKTQIYSTVLTPGGFFSFSSCIAANCTAFMCLDFFPDGGIFFL